MPSKMFFTIAGASTAVIRRLAHEFIVPGLECHVEGEKKHPQPFDLVDAHPRVLLQARDLMIGHIVDEIRLTGLQAPPSARRLQ